MAAKTSLPSIKRNLPEELAELVKALQQNVSGLQKLAEQYAPNLKFTLDGRLVGDIGELLAAMELGIKIQTRQETGFDGIDAEGRNVELKTTFKDSFAFRKIAERVICIKLHGSTEWEIIFDGQGTELLEEFPETSFNGPREITREIPASLNSQRQLAISKFKSLSAP